MIYIKVQKVPPCWCVSQTKYTLHQRANIHRTILHDLIMVHFATDFSDLFLHFFKCLIHIELKLSFSNDSNTKTIRFGFPKCILMSILTKVRQGYTSKIGKYLGTEKLDPTQGPQENEHSNHSANNTFQFVKFSSEMQHFQHMKLRKVSKS